MSSVKLFLLCCLPLVALAAKTTTTPPLGPSTAPTPAAGQLDVHVMASPAKMHEGFTKYLSVNCTFNHAASSDFRTIMSLILSKSSSPADDNFQEIATVTAFSNDVEVTSSLGAVVHGHLEHMSESFIAFEWKYPTSAVEGKYRCEAYGMDKRGHPRDTQAVTTVTERAVDISMVLENMKKMDVELDELLTFKQDMTSRLLQSMMALMETSALYNGKTYYLSRPMVKNTAVAESLCQLYGGELLVLDNTNEMNFVGNFLQNNNINDTIALGLSDEAHEGTWVTLSSGAAASFLKWQSGHVNGGTSKNCLYFDGTAMVDDECFGLSFSRFVCEM